MFKNISERNIMNMKLQNVLFAGALALSLGACSSNTPSAASSASSSSSKDEVVTEGHYNVANVTGKTVTELYFYQTGSEDKGENYAADGLEAGKTVTVDITVDEETAAAGYAMTVEYTAEGGEPVVVFDNLHLEEADMYLKKAKDVTGGATPFSIVTTGTYNVTNVTGEKVTALYFYQTGSEDKGENYAADGLDVDASVTVDIEVDKEAAIAGYAMTIEFETESGATAVAFDNLHLEEANMYLKPAADVEGGATPFLNAE